MSSTRFAFSLFLSIGVSLAACGDDGGGGGGGGDGDGGLGVVVIESVAPARGPLAGGNPVTIRGQGFEMGNAGANMVLIGGRLGTSVVTVDDNTITFLAPEGEEVGTADVVVFNSNGVGTGLYSYNPLPTLTGLSPARGPYQGGTEITLTGTGFLEREAGATTVWFGEVAVSNPTVVSDTEIRVTSPRNIPLTAAEVRVENRNGPTDGREYRYTASGLFAAAGTQLPQHQGKAYFIDHEGGEAFYVGTIRLKGQPVPVTGMVYVSDTLYVFTGPTQGGWLLLKIPDIFTLEAEALGPIAYNNNPLFHFGGGGGPGSASCRDVASDGSTVFCMHSSDLLRVDLSVPSATLVGNTQGGSRGGIAVSSDGTLLHATDQELYRLNKVTGVATKVTDLLLLDRVNGAAYLDGNLYVSAHGFQAFLGGGGGRSPGIVYRVNTATGVAEEVAVIPGGHLDSIVVIP